MPEEEESLEEMEKRLNEETLKEEPTKPSPEEEKKEEVEEPTEPVEPEKKLAGKFLTPEDLEKGYVELEKDYTRKSQALAEREAYLQALAIQQQTQQQQQPQPGVDPSKDLESLAQKPREFVQEVAGQIAEQQTYPLYEQLNQQQQIVAHQIEVANFKSAHPDWEKHTDSMNEVIKESPGLTTLPIGQRFETIFRLAEAREIKKGQADALKDSYRKGTEAGANKEQLKDKTKVAKPSAERGQEKKTEDMTSEEFAKSEGLQEGPDLADKPRM